jgi:hypothetical protein
MTEDEKMKKLDEFVLNIEVPIRVMNVTLNALNMPYQTPSLTHAELIAFYQNQAGPQAEKAKAALEAVTEKPADE